MEVKSNIKIKSIKEPVQFGLSLMLPSLLQGFKTPTYGDYERITGLMELFKKIHAEQAKHVQTIYDELSIPEEESIDSNHPLYSKVTNLVLEGKSSVMRSDLQVFSVKELNAAVEGSFNLSFADRRLLMYWLVKEEKAV
jgi:hypothetical protein